LNSNLSTIETHLLSDGGSNGLNFLRISFCSSSGGQVISLDNSSTSDFTILIRNSQEFMDGNGREQNGASLMGNVKARKGSSKEPSPQGRFLLLIVLLFAVFLMLELFLREG
jgi:hypothetical protein